MPYPNMRRTPPRVVVACSACGTDVVAGGPGVAQEVVGWLAPRKGGGPNHIRNQKPTGKYRHVACLNEDDGDQGSLF